MKKTLSLTLALLLLLLLVPFSALADDDVPTADDTDVIPVDVDVDVIPVDVIIEKPELDEIVALLNIGDFFRGTNNGYELDRAPTRAEAAVAFVRMLGKEEWAQANMSTMKAHPFTDVPYWANPHVAYMYDAGLTQGVSATAFGSSSTVTAAQFYTFVLRALGYAEGEGKDFLYTDAINFAKLMVITDGVAADGDTFLRGDMAVAMYECLMATPVDSDAILIRKMVTDGVIPAYIAELFEGENEIYNFMQEVGAASADVTSVTMTIDAKSTESAPDGDKDTAVKGTIKTVGANEDWQVYTELTEEPANETVKMYMNSQNSYSYVEGQWKEDLFAPADILGLDINSITSMATQASKSLLANSTLTRKDGKVELVYTTDFASLFGLVDGLIALEDLDITMPDGDIVYTYIFDDATCMLESMKLAIDMDMGEEGKASITADITISGYNTTTITLDEELKALIDA